MNAISTVEQLAVCPAHHEQLRSALDHIARTCVASRTQTRRIRWIEARATGALRGEPFLQEAISLPKDGGPKTAEAFVRSGLDEGLGADEMPPGTENEGERAEQREEAISASRKRMQKHGVHAHT